MVAIIAVIIATAIFHLNPTEDCLILRNGRTGSILASYPMEEGGEFSVRFIHSVNKSPVEDRYRIENNQIVVYETAYYNFGAGVQTALEEGQTLSYAEDGAMIISGFDKPIGDLSYIVSPVYDHILLVNEEEISLRQLCGEERLVSFRYEKGKIGFKLP
ncbi:MAG: DUF1850 domain-containing protein [Anaerotignum sp.]|nr:DUF1850 domain-containing protein [Anaerotignum sp.]